MRRSPPAWMESPATRPIAGRSPVPAFVKLAGSRPAVDHTRWVEVLVQPPPRPCRPPVPLLDRQRTQLGRGGQETVHRFRECVLFTEDAPEGT